MAEKTFEMQLEELQAIVAQIEKGDRSLEEMVALYEEGIKLYKACHDRINDAKVKIELLNQSLEE